MSESLHEGSPHPFRVSKADSSRDGLDGLRTSLQPQSGSFDAQALDSLGWRLSSFLSKSTPELTRAEPCCLGEAFNRKWLG